MSFLDCTGKGKSGGGVTVAAGVVLSDGAPHDPRQGARGENLDLESHRERLCDLIQMYSSASTYHFAMCYFSQPISIRSPEPFKIDEKSTCGAATATFNVTTVDIGAGWSKAGNETEAERVMVRLLYARADAAVALESALEQYARKLITIDDFGKIFEEQKFFIPINSDLYQRCNKLTKGEGAAKAEVSDRVTCHRTDILHELIPTAQIWRRQHAHAHAPHKYTCIYAHTNTCASIYRCRSHYLAQAN